ncbi:MAG: HAD-IA family hydrolase [Chloroflexi bacterium]|nr:HAD-IA family hydrolase [Chloroflexota bacterium]
MKLLAILFDLGDVIMKEETEVKDAELSTQSADLVDGMSDALRAFKKRGYKLGLVADTRPKTYWNVLHQHDLYDLFDAFAISEEVGVEKPDARLFEAALNTLGIARQDYSRVAMVGNNLARDIRGANNLGIISIWFHWNERYPVTDDKPDYEVKSAGELMELVERLESL